MSSQLIEIQKKLRQASSKSNTDFFRKMVPGHQTIYGVKSPVLNSIAAQYRLFSYDLAEELWKAGALEEKIIATKIIEKEGKKDPARTLNLFKKFALQIDNWAVCDGLGMLVLRGIVKTHANEIFELAAKFNRSKDPWQRRLSLVMVEWYTREKKFMPKIKKLVANLENDEEYYVKKALSWIKRNFVKGK